MARNRKYTQSNSRKPKKRRIRLEALCVVIFLCSAMFYGITKIGLTTYNITLQQQEQSLAAEINQRQSAVEDLQAEVASLQDKSRVLDMLSDQVQDNSANVYIVGNSD